MKNQLITYATAVIKINYRPSQFRYQEGQLQDSYLKPLAKYC